MLVREDEAVVHISLVAAGNPFPEVARAFRRFAGREFTREEIEIGACYLIRFHVVELGQSAEEVAAFCEEVALPIDRETAHGLAKSFLQDDPLR